jgi:hypothetical protein
MRCLLRKYMMDSSIVEVHPNLQIVGTALHSDIELPVGHMAVLQEGLEFSEVVGHLWDACLHPVHIFDHVVLQKWRQCRHHSGRVWIVVVAWKDFDLARRSVMSVAGQ